MPRTPKSQIGGGRRRIKRGPKKTAGEKQAEALGRLLEISNRKAGQTREPGNE
jgi:hypothetical protein